MEIEKILNEMATEARIDKLNLSGVLIDDVADLTELERKGMLTRAKNSDERMRQCHTLTGKDFTNLIIEDDYFGKLKAGLNFGTGQEYGTLNTHVRNDLGVNLVCNSVTEYAEQLEDTKRYIAEQYGVTLNFIYLKVNTIEINRTFRIDEHFAAYRRPLDVIAANIPRKKRMSQIRDVSFRRANGIEKETMYITSKICTKDANGKFKKSKQYEEIVFYSKSKQIEKIIALSEHYMRVEIRLCGATKVKKMLGTNLFYNLTDDRINQFFDREINELIVNPLRKWKVERAKKLIKLMRELRQDDKKHWTKNLLIRLLNDEIESGIPVALDVNELMPLIDKIGVDDRAERYRIRRSIRRNAKKYANALTQDDDVKLGELCDRLTEQRELKRVTHMIA